MKNPKPKIMLTNALISHYKSRLSELSDEDLACFTHRIANYVYYWIGELTLDRLSSLRLSMPLLNDLVDFETVIVRLQFADRFKRDIIGVDIDSIFPELITIRDTCWDLIRALPNGIHKAECWLLPFALEAGSDADIEASIYFASRGKGERIEVGKVQESWRIALCNDIEHGKPIGWVPDDLLERARSRTLSLAAIAEILRPDMSFLRVNFLSARDEEEDYIDPTLFRAVDWLGIPGFRIWLESLIEELSVGPQKGIEHWTTGWSLFHWCRSDLALKMADRQGLEAWLWGLLNGSLERGKPWRIYGGKSNEGKLSDSIGLAGIISFVWHRIHPGNIKEDVLNDAVELMLQTQVTTGGWPLFADEAEPCLLSTCLAVHGIALHKPIGWERILSRAANWIKSQQMPSGCWHIEGGSPIMLTVLALDSINLAGVDQVTFRMLPTTLRETNLKPHIIETSNEAEEPIYDCKGQPWYQPTLPPITPKSFEEARNAFDAKVALIVATETELRQVLRLFKPLSNKRAIWRVVYGCETYYIGRFGVFETVMMMCSMGSQGASGATLSANSTIDAWNPSAVVLIGIAFGADRQKHLPGDVLVAESLIPYEIQRVGEKPVFRNPIPPSSPTLINRFRNALDWRFKRPDNTLCSCHIGPILSGEKLVDNREFKAALLKQFPNAIGGEMEGSGLWSAAHRRQKDWILIKAVCDWGDGQKHNSYQAMAAAASASLCHYVFSDSHALDGL